MTMATFTLPAVIPSAEFRKQLPSVLRRFRAERASAAPVVIGAHRKPEAVVISYDLFEALIPLIDDREIAEITRKRIAAGPPESIDDLAAAFGVDFDNP